jgi:hypothetical protein
MDQCGHYLTKIGFNHFDAVSCNPSDEFAKRHDACSVENTRIPVIADCARQIYRAHGLQRQPDTRVLF